MNSYYFIPSSTFFFLLFLSTFFFDELLSFFIVNELILFVSRKEDIFLAFIWDVLNASMYTKQIQDPYFTSLITT